MRADPRSHWRPYGTAGWSRVVDHGSFEWTDSLWHGVPFAGSVFYELHVGAFTPEGTLAAAAERLAHLVELGVTTIELMPLAELPGARGWGYDGVFLYAPHHVYGGPDGLKRVVDAYRCREGVILGRRRFGRRCVGEHERGDHASGAHVNSL